MCTEHADEQIRLCCCQCKTPMCIVCYTSRHNGHACNNITEISHILPPRQKISEVLRNTEQVLERLHNRKVNVVNHFARIMEHIHETADNYIAAADRHRYSLLSEVNNIKADLLEEIEQAETNPAISLKPLESVFQDVHLLLTGQRCQHDVAILLNRAKELTSVDITYTINSDAKLPTFKPSLLIDASSNNVLGQLQGQST